MTRSQKKNLTQIRAMDVRIQFSLVTSSNGVQPNAEHVCVIDTQFTKEYFIGPVTYKSLNHQT